MSHSFSPPSTPEPVVAPTISLPDRVASPVEPREPRPSWRLAAALLLGGPLWVAPFVAGISVLLPARLEALAPDDKVRLVATVAVAGSLVALVANVLFGALSDLTRSRLGARTPWMLLGSVASGALLASLSTVDSVPVLVLAWCAFQFFLNAIVAPFVAIIPDRVPVRLRGTYSGMYGVGVLVGAGLGGVVAARFVTDPTHGFLVFGVVVALTGPLFAVLAPDSSNRHVPRAPFSRTTVLANFAFPRRGARDYYLAMAGKLLIMVAVYMISGYQLFIATDYLDLSAAAAGGLIATVSLVQLGLSLLFAGLAGPVSDRIGRRKAPVVFSALLFAVATVVPFVWPTPAAMIVFAVVGLGAAQGIFNSVDQALNYDVLPSAEAAAKDLGILNMATTGGQTLGPVAMSVVVSISGGYGAGFLLSAAISVLAAVVVSRIHSAR
jgi:MFS family permease